MVEGPFTWKRDSLGTATNADGIPVFGDVSFRTLESARAVCIIESVMLYIIADDQVVAVNTDPLRANGSQLYTTKACAGH